MGNALQRSDLVGDNVAEFGWIDVEKASTESRQIGIGDMRANRNAEPRGHVACAPHDRWVTGMEPTRNGGARDDAKQCLVVT